MVRALLIRRVFIWLDFALVFALLFTLGMVARGILLGPAPGTGSGVVLDENLMVASNSLSPLMGRADYDAIISSGIFGEAGRYDPSAQPIVEESPKPSEPDATPKTPLNLRLIGTTATDPTDRFASAIIEDKDQRNAVRSYGIDDAIVDNVFLKEVYSRYVIIMNERMSPPEKQRLSMDDEDKLDNAIAARSGAEKPAAPPQADSAPETVTINRQELLQEVYMNYADLVGKVRPRMVRDESGQISGVTADNIGDIPIAQKLGIGNGDVLQSVNNERIDSEQKIMEMVQKYRESPSIRIGIMRNGKPKTITYNMQ